MTKRSAGDVVWVNFPFVESNRSIRRPALVVSAHPLGPDGLVIWVAMITNAMRPSWPCDIEITDLGAAGLNHPSKIRIEKVATVAVEDTVYAGRVDAAILAKIHNHLQSWIAGS